MRVSEARADERSVKTDVEENCAHGSERSVPQYKFLQQLRHNPSIDTPHPLCRRLSSLTYAHLTHAISVAASVGLIATCQAAQSNKSAWELFAISEIAFALT